MEWTKQSVRKALGDKLIGKLYMREAVCEAIQLLPAEMIKTVCKNVWFISTPEDAWGITFKGHQIKDFHLIFLSEDLFSQTNEQIQYSILHEIGHVVLNHDNSIGIMQSQGEIDRQEKEADEFAKQQPHSN